MQNSGPTISTDLIQRNSTMTNFDKHAKNYDAVFTYSQIGKAQRMRVYHFLNKQNPTDKKQNILELNCGTGEDAQYFAQQGHSILATDISTEMMKVAKEKNKYPNIRFQQLDISKVTKDTFSEKFDMIFSNFGGLNCLSKSQLVSFFQASESLLKPSGKMVLVIMPKNCLWELFYFSIKGEFKKARRRNTNKPLVVNVEGNKVKTWYYNPKEVMSLASDIYKVTAIKPIGIKIPPSYLESFFSSKKGVLKLLIWAEKLYSNRFWAKYADHYLISFQKK